jgi:hypothetical protein
MREMIQRLWARAWVCLIVSLVGFAAGGILLFAAVQEIYGDYSASCRAAGATCHDPRGWLVIALTVAGFGLFALGATTWVRAFYLVDQGRRRRAAAV